MPTPESRTSKRTPALAERRGFRAQAQTHPAALGELDRVAKQIQQDLLEPLCVADDPVCELAGPGRAPATGPCLRRWHETERSQTSPARAGTWTPWARFSFPASILEWSRTSFRISIKELPDDGRGVDQMPLARVELRMTKEIKRAEDAVHRRPDLMTHGRKKLRFGQVGGLGGVFCLEQRGVRQIFLQTVPNRARRGVAHFSGCANHGQAEYRDQDGERPRAHVVDQKADAQRPNPWKGRRARLKDLPTRDMNRAAVATEPIAMTTTWSRACR